MTRKSTKIIFAVFLFFVFILVYDAKKTPKPSGQQQMGGAGQEKQMASTEGVVEQTNTRIHKNPNEIQSKFSTSSQQTEKDKVIESFHESLKCHALSITIEDLQNRVNACTSGPEPSTGLKTSLNDSNAAQCKLDIQNLSKEIDEKNLQSANCSAIPANVEDSYYQSVKQAAKLGDTDAQMCYLNGDFNPSGGPTDQDIQEYISDATKYAQDAIARGDWQVAQLLSISSNSIGHGAAGWRINLPTIGSPLEVYRMNRLLQLGATGEYAESLDALISNVSANISPQQMVKADTWAQQTYNSYFKNSSKLDKAPAPCASSD